MTVRLTANAAKRIAEILTKQQKRALRLSIQGGKCAGFAYQYDLVDEVQDDDFQIKEGGAYLVIDPVSLPFLTGAEIDFVSNLLEQSFKINNPNAVSSCGCGLSFSI